MKMNPAVILLGSLAPCEPLLAQMVGKARGDLGFAGAIIPLVAVGTVPMRAGHILLAALGLFVSDALVLWLVPPMTARAAIAFPASITLPPPTATKQSHFAFL